MERAEERVRLKRLSGGRVRGLQWQVLTESRWKEEVYIHTCGGVVAGKEVVMTWVADGRQVLVLVPFCLKYETVSSGGIIGSDGRVVGTF